MRILAILAFGAACSMLFTLVVLPLIVHGLDALFGSAVREYTASHPPQEPLR